jgi:hypothetical protein
MDAFRGRLSTDLADRQAEVPIAGQKAPLWLRICFWISIVIAVAVVVRRILALANPPKSAPPLMAGLDAAFGSHAALTLVHIVPALAFVLILPFYFYGNARVAARARSFIFPLGAIVGLTAYAMSAYSVGGWTERSAILVFNTLFLIALGRGFVFMTRHDTLRERRWLLRAIVILLGIATTRPVMGVFFATAPLTHLVPSQFFGIAFWIGFSNNAFGVELWIRFTQRPAMLPNR